MQEQEEFFFADRQEWRKWLNLNHNKSDGIWVVYFKKHVAKPSLKYHKGVEEALCFGWIDSTVKTVDNERYKQKYTPRRKNSVWSEINKNRVGKMIKEKKMTEAGLLLIEEAKKNGQWEKAYGTRKKSEMPTDLKESLSKNKAALENFQRFAPSHQNTYINWLNAAKRDETRKKRIKQIISFAEMNKKPGLI